MYLGRDSVRRESETSWTEANFRKIVIELNTNLS